MTILELRIKLSRIGTVQICKEGIVFTLLLTGENLSNKVNEITESVVEATQDKYPDIEAMRNDENFYCIVLKQKEG